MRRMMMTKYVVDINGTFTAVVNVEIDADVVKDETEEDIEQMIYGLAEKQLNEMLDKNDLSLVDNIELECIDNVEID
jgi:hypothetical protein